MLKANELDAVLTKSYRKVTILEVFDEGECYLVEGPDLPENLEVNVFTMPFNEVIEIIYFELNENSSLNKLVKLLIEENANYYVEFSKYICFQIQAITIWILLSK